MLHGGFEGGAIGGAQGGARKAMFQREHCSPGESDVEGSCLDDDIVIQVAKALNKMCKGKKKKKLYEIDLNRSPEDIHGDVCENIKQISKCSSEACWQTIKSLMKELGSDKERFKDSFKPLMPKKWIKDYNEWLSTYEIEDCLEQHMNDDKFHFYGAVPIDFKKCSVSNLCSFNLKKHIKNNKSKIGIVFNTDPSDKDGQHWISMYIDIDGINLSGQPGIYYFDSFGKDPSHEIKELVHKVKSQGNKCNKNFRYFYNDIPFQKKNNQCGMFSIHFIKKMLDGLSFVEYLKTPLSDKVMIDLRDEYFVKL